MYTQKQESIVISAFRKVYDRNPSLQEMQGLYNFDFAEFEKLQELGAYDTFEEYFGEEDGWLIVR